MTTDRQAALAAASEIMGAFLRSSSSPRLSAQQSQAYTIGTANAFLAWLQGNDPMRASADERLIPNEDFRSPSAARTERINPNDVTFAAAERERAAAIQATAQLDQIPRSPGATYAGVHMLAPEHCVTPSGKRACQCGQAWPCSQSLAGRP